MNNEPLITVGTVTAAVTALLAAAVAFGLDLTDEQTTAVLAVVAVLAPFVVAFTARGKVTPTANPRTSDGMPLVRADPLNRPFLDGGQ
jgi:hypothetical protein